MEMMQAMMMVMMTMMMMLLLHLPPHCSQHDHHAAYVMAGRRFPCLPARCFFGD